MMRLAAVRTKLEGVLVPRQERGFFKRLWGLTQEPVVLQSTALSALLKQAASARGKSVQRGPALAIDFDAACRELEANVAALQALADSREHPPFAYVTWLWRVAQALEKLERDGWLEPPSRTADPPDTREARLLPFPTEPLLAPLPAGPQLRGLALQPLLDLANRETRQLGRRRRLLEAARRVLLESAASVEMPPRAVEARALSIAEQIRELNQWQAAGVDPDVAVSHQLQQAVTRRDSAQVSSLLKVLDDLVRTSPEQARLGRRLSALCSKLGAGFEPEPPRTLAALAERTFGETAARAVRRGSERAQRELGVPATAEAELVRAGSSVDGAFELGRSVAPVRVLEEQRRMAAVDFPTQNMLLELARNVEDLPTSLIGDPRLVLYDLASQTLLARRYLAQRKRKVATSARYSEARYYLLDGSASMAGRRGRMRDAIVISELGTMIRHLEHGNATARPIVYYRYFSKGTEPVVRASSIEEASACIEALLIRKSRGETDIEGALLGSFQELAREREREPTLKRAQLVLVTDGVAPVNIERVWQARESLGDLPVQVSVIALGSENPALKQLASLQRARGEAVFYHYLSDPALYQLARGVQVSSGATPVPLSLSLVPSVSAAAAPATATPAPDALWSELGALVDELSVLHEPPDLERLEQAQYLEAAYEEAGLSLSDNGFEAERAHCEAQKRDLRALCGRFDRWFPELEQLGRAREQAPSHELLDVIEVVLVTVAELIAYLDGAPLQRRVDAIELLERLLLEAGVAPWTYQRALPHATRATRVALEGLRSLVSSRDPR